MENVFSMTNVIRVLPFERPFCTYANGCFIYLNEQNAKMLLVTSNEKYDTVMEVAFNVLRT